LAPAQVHGNWYGAPLQPLRAAFEAGKDVLLKIDVQGAISVRRRIPQAVFLFLAPPSRERLVERLGSRQTESPQELERRVRDASYEMAQLPHYDYCVVNRDDDLPGTIASVACVISAERLRINRQPINLAPH
jgi:guanylate kinase